MLLCIAVVIFAYLLGSINFAVIFSKAFIKKDVREVGSGNAGATNVLRSAGVLPGALTFLCDALKGLAASYFGKVVFEMMEKSTAEESGIIGAYICGLACMLGHVFPIFFKFKGGKGVATSVGIFLVCSPAAIGLGIVAFLAVVLATRYVSLASVIAALVVVISACVLSPVLSQIVISVLMGIIVILKHSTNIKRLLNGTENKIGGKSNG